MPAMKWVERAEEDSAAASLEKRLWAAADQLRANSGLKAQEYSSPILGLIFLRFAEVRFEQQRAKLAEDEGTSRRASRIDEPAAYHAASVLYLVPEARFDYLLTLPEAAVSIGAVFRVAGMTSSPVAVHILSVENTPVIAVEGDLTSGPQPLPLYDSITVADAVRLAGGRKPSSSAHGLYITREGQKRYFRSITAANEWRLAAGDIIHLSADH